MTLSKKRLRSEGWKQGWGNLWQDPYSNKLYTWVAATNICASRQGMVPGDPIQFVLDAHYHLMEDKKYWYEPGMIDASRILCVAASDMREAERKRDVESGLLR